MFSSFFIFHCCRFQPHGSQTSWKITLLESMRHNSSNDCSDTDFILSVFHHARSSYCLSLALDPAPFSQSSIYSVTSPTLILSFTVHLPRQPYMSSAVSSSSVAAAVDLEAKLTTCSECQTLSVKDCSLHRHREVPVEVLSKRKNHQQWMSNGRIQHAVTCTVRLTTISKFTLWSHSTLALKYFCYSKKERVSRSQPLRGAHWVLGTLCHKEHKRSFFIG